MKTFLRYICRFFGKKNIQKKTQLRDWSILVETNDVRFSFSERFPPTISLIYVNFIFDFQNIGRENCFKIIGGVLDENMYTATLFGSLSLSIKNASVPAIIFCNSSFDPYTGTVELQ